MLVEEPWLLDVPVKDSICHMKDNSMCVLLWMCSTCLSHMFPHHQETGEKVILAETHCFLDALNMLSPA